MKPETVIVRPVQDKHLKGGGDIVSPLVNLDEAAQAFNDYQKLKHKLVAQGHFVKFKDRDGREREAQTRQWPAGSPGSLAYRWTS